MKKCPELMAHPLNELTCNSLAITQRDVDWWRPLTTGYSCMNEWFACPAVLARQSCSTGTGFILPMDTVMTLWFAKVLLRHLLNAYSHLWLISHRGRGKRGIKSRGSGSSSRPNQKAQSFEMANCIYCELLNLIANPISFSNLLKKNRKCCSSQCKYRCVLW